VLRSSGVPAGRHPSDRMGSARWPPPRESDRPRSSRTRPNGARHGAFVEPRGRNGWRRLPLLPTPNRCVQAQSFATACHRLRPRAHGKEGVDGSSPSEGLQNRRSPGFSVQNDLLFVVRAVGMEPLMELSCTRLDLFRAEEEVEGSENGGSAKAAGRHAAPSRRSWTSSSLRISKLAKPR